jgi:hypothetical protein
MVTSDLVDGVDLAQTVDDVPSRTGNGQFRKKTARWQELG